MTKISDLNRSSLTPTSNYSEKMHWGKDAKSAEISPHKIVPVIDRSKVDPGVVKAAEGMEAMFIDQLMQVMRQTLPKQDMDLESPASQIYRSMLDSEYSQKAAHGGGIGLADLIITYIDSRRYNLPEGHGVPTKEKP